MTNTIDSNSTNVNNSNVDVHKEGVNNMSNNEISTTNTNELTFSTFNNEMFGLVRGCRDENGEAWLYGNDVATALGYENPAEAIQDHVDEDDRKLLKYKDNSKTPESKILWNNPNDFKNKVMITESGMYSLIFGSKLPSTKEFKKWVTSEVLPSIRKHGAYVEAKTAKEWLSDPSFMMTTLQTLMDERKAKEQAIAQKEQALLQLETSNKEKDALQANYNLEVEKHRLVNEALVSVKEQFKGVARQSEKNFQLANTNYNAWKEEKEKRVELEKNVENFKVEVKDYFENFFETLEMKDLTSFKELSAIIGDSKLGRNKIMRFLRERKILNLNNIPYVQYQTFFKVRENRGQNNRIFSQTFMTKNGVAYVINLLKKNKLIGEEIALPLV